MDNKQSTGLDPGFYVLCGIRQGPFATLEQAKEFALAIAPTTNYKSPITYIDDKGIPHGQDRV